MMDDSWHAYYEEQGIREPRELLLSTLDAFPAAGEAVDLGCGQGFETEAMLQRGWRVLAVDAEPEAIERLAARVGDAGRARLRTRVSPMAEVSIPPVDLAWASFSLFFNPPERFDDVWSAIRGAVRPGGRFAGEVLGDRDTWAADADITALSRADAERRFDGWTIERFEEEESDGETISGPKHWHVFHVVARAPGVPPVRGAPT
jgi:SAM-dependent methyltransferase